MRPIYLASHDWETDYRPAIRWVSNCGLVFRDLEGKAVAEAILKFIEATSSPEEIEEILRGYILVMKGGK